MSKPTIGHDVVLITDHDEYPIVRDVLIDGRRIWMPADGQVTVDAPIAAGCVQVNVPVFVRSLRFTTAEEAEQSESGAIVGSESAK